MDGIDYLARILELNLRQHFYTNWRQLNFDKSFLNFDLKKIYAKVTLNLTVIIEY